MINRHPIENPNKQTNKQTKRKEKRKKLSKSKPWGWEQCGAASACANQVEAASQRPEASLYRTQSFWGSYSRWHDPQFASSQPASQRPCLSSSSLHDQNNKHKFQHTHHQQYINSRKIKFIHLKKKTNQSSYVSETSHDLSQRLDLVDSNCRSRRRRRAAERASAAGRRV